jgi:hypothetical protein
MALKRLSNGRSISSGEPPEIFHGLLRQDDLVFHSGYILARTWKAVNWDEGGRAACSLYNSHLK